MGGYGLGGLGVTGYGGDTAAAMNTELRAIIRNLLGMPVGSVRPSNQNAPTGMIMSADGSPDQFATVHIDTLERGGWDEVSCSNDPEQLTVTETVTGQRMFTASIQFFRGDAIAKAYQLEALMQSSSAHDQLAAASFGFITTKPVRNMTGLVDTFWEERSQLEIELYTTVKVEVTLPTFGTFPVSTKVSDKTVNEVIVLL